MFCRFQLFVSLKDQAKCTFLCMRLDDLWDKNSSLHLLQDARTFLCLEGAVVLKEHTRNGTEQKASERKKVHLGFKRNPSFKSDNILGSSFTALEIWGIFFPFFQ